jgi:predicted ATPase/serine/threonine protein kinase
MSELINDRYEVLADVENSARGRLVQACDRRHERLVAIKFLRGREGGTTADQVSEAGVLLRLRPHPGIPTVRDDFFLDGAYAIVMDWVEGRDLARVVDEQGDPGLPFATALGYVTQAAAALDHLHQHDPPVIHGDVKPANLILTPSGEIVLVDFGIASFGPSSRRAGSRGYVAPEVAAGARISPATDVYGLAATAVTLLTGRPPAAFADWSSSEPEADRRIIRSLRRALSTDPGRRPPSAGDLAERLAAGHAPLPTGIVTFLGTDVDGAAELWETRSDAMTDLCDRLGDVVCEVVESHGGRSIKSTGEDTATLSVFTEASSAASAAIALHQTVAESPWPSGIEVALRIALRTGEAELRDGWYVGPTVNRLASLRDLSPAKGTLLCQTTADLVLHRLPEGYRIADAGSDEPAGPGRRDRVHRLVEMSSSSTTSPIDGSVEPADVWLLATDIERATEILQDSRQRYRAMIEEYRERLESVAAAEGGALLSLVDDTAVLRLPTAQQAIGVALAVVADAWDGPNIRVGIHVEVRGQGPEVVDTVTGAGVLAVCLAAHGGQILVSEAAQQRLTDGSLPDGSLKDLGVHRLTDLNRPQRLYQLVYQGNAHEFPDVHTLDTHPNNLPVQLTRFVGRRVEIEHVVSLVLENRLCTITGAGGAGKTRLALQAAGRVLSSFADGVWFADLSDVDARLAPAIVASSVGAREGGSGTFAAPGRRPRRSAVDRFVDHLEYREALVVLDGCEHVLDTCQELCRRLLLMAPRTKILVTSRAPLDLPGEATYRLGPLSVPAPEATPEEARQSAAVCLFVDRATLRRSDLRMDDATTAEVATICRQVEGIPLAIELAAARVAVLALPKLASLLEDRLGLLANSSPNVAARQATLRATIEWSESTLSEQERTLFRRLAVFAGGFSLEAAQQVCAGHGLERPEVLDLLASLVDKSLIETEIDRGDLRYRLLDATRQYAMERCTEAGEDALMRTAHRAWCLALAEEAAEDLSGSRQRQCLDELDRNYENLCTAMRAASTDAGFDDLRIAAALGHYWLVRGLVSEGSNWLAGALDRDDRAPAPLLAAAQCAAGILACFAGNYARAEEVASHTLALSPRLVGQRWRARALAILGLALSGEGRFDLALQRQQEAITGGERADDPWGTAFAVNNAANLLALRGSGAAARQLYDRALRIRRDRGDTWGISWSLFRLGSLLAAQGDFDEALSHLDESLAESRSLQYGQGALLALLGLGEVNDLLCRSGHADSLYREAVLMARELEEPTAACLALAGLASLAIARRDLSAARTALAEDDFRDDPSLASRAALLRGRAQLAEAEGHWDTAEAWRRELLLMRRELGDQRALVEELEALGRIARHRGSDHRAAVLLGAASNMRSLMGFPVPPRDGPATDAAADGLDLAHARDPARALEAAVEEALTPG